MSPGGRSVQNYSVILKPGQVAPRIHPSWPFFFPFRCRFPPCFSPQRLRALYLLDDVPWLQIGYQLSSLAHHRFDHLYPPPLVAQLHLYPPPLQAFTRVTQQEPDHGEAWNNIAALWVQLERNKEAFSALGECIKHKKDSWQVSG